MTLNIHIDGDRAEQLLTHRVRGYEDLVYRMFDAAPSCRYEHGGCPSCLIGCALFDAGVPLEALRELDSMDPDVPGSSSIDGVKLPEGLSITPKALAMFKAAQATQDMGYAWGVALQEAVHAGIEFGDER